MYIIDKKIMQTYLILFHFFLPVLVTLQMLWFAAVCSNFEVNRLLYDLGLLFQFQKHMKKQITFRPIYYEVADTLKFPTLPQQAKIHTEKQNEFNRIQFQWREN